MWLWLWLSRVRGVKERCDDNLQCPFKTRIQNQKTPHLIIASKQRLEENRIPLHLIDPYHTIGSRSRRRFTVTTVCFYLATHTLTIILLLLLLRGVSLGDVWTLALRTAA